MMAVPPRLPHITKRCPRCGQGRAFLVPASLRAIAAVVDPAEVLSAMQCDVRIAPDGRVVTLCGERLTLTASDVVCELVAAHAGRT